MRRYILRLKMSQTRHKLKGQKRSDVRAIIHQDYQTFIRFRLLFFYSNDAIFLIFTDPKLVSRRDKVFSQSLITAISSFAIQLRSAIGGTFNNMKVNDVISRNCSNYSEMLSKNIAAIKSLLLVELKMFDKTDANGGF